MQVGLMTQPGLLVILQELQIRKMEVMTLLSEGIRLSMWGGD